MRGFRGSSSWLIVAMIVLMVSVPSMGEKLRNYQDLPGTQSMKRKADLHKQHDAGHYPNTEDKAARELAMAIHVSEDVHCVVSWSAQERAQDFFNEHGLAATLDEITRLKPLRLPGAYY